VKKTILVIALLALLLTLAAWEVWEAPGTFDSSPIYVRRLPTRTIHRPTTRADKQQWIDGFVER
jgi:hypothetical protein